MKRGDVCYDIGGYRGYICGVMALAGASSVIVFEPLPENQRALRRLCELNPHLPIQVQPIALGGMDTQLTLVVMPDDSMGKLVTSVLASSDESSSLIAVAVRSIDSLVENGEIPPPNVLKIDVEGAELEVLRGAATTLRAQRPIVFLEAHSRSIEDSCVRELEGHGYTSRRIGPEPGADEHARHLVARHQWIERESRVG